MEKLEKSDQDAPERVVRVKIAPQSVLWIIALGAAVWLVIKLWTIVMVLVMALILVGTLNPLVERLQKRGLSRTLSVLMILLAMLTIGGLIGALVAPALFSEISVAAAHAPTYQKNVAHWLEKKRLLAPLAQTVRGIGSGDVVKGMTAQALAMSQSVLLIVGYIVSTIFLAFYLIADRERARGALYAVVPRAYHLRMARILLNLQTIVGGYMRGQAITSAAMALFAFLLLFALGVPNALALAVFAGLTDVLPFVGGLLATIPCVLAALARSSWIAIVVLAAMVVYQEFESRVLVPRIYGRVLRLPAAAVLVALLIGGALLGILGALLALPIAAALRMVVKELRVELPGEDIDDHRIRERDERQEKLYARRSAGAPVEDAAAIAVEMADDVRQADAKDAEDAKDAAEAAEVPITGGQKEKEPSKP